MKILICIICLIIVAEMSSAADEFFAKPIDRLPPLPLPSKPLPSIIN